MEHVLSYRIMDETIENKLAGYGIEPLALLMAIAAKESSIEHYRNGQRRVVKKSYDAGGANVGIMQIKPLTAKSVGINNVYGVADNILGAAMYVAANLETCRTVKGALTNYGAGPNGRCNNSSYSEDVAENYWLFYEVLSTEK